MCSSVFRGVPDNINIHILLLLLYDMTRDCIIMHRAAAGPRVVHYHQTFRPPVFIWDDYYYIAAAATPPPADVIANRL